MASEVVAATSLMSTTEYQGGFDDISNVEWLWGADITTLTSTLYASFFSHMDAVNLAGYAGIGVLKVVDASLYDSMADNDVRKACVDGFGDDDYTYYPGLQLKFRDDTKSFEGDYVFLRSAEAYYIKAEAEAAQDKISDAQATLDIISDARATDGVSTYVWSSDKTELIDQIFLHKRIEMWGEGFGLFEFNRLMKTIDRTYDGTNHPAGNVIGGDRAIPWGDTARYMQIPNSELEGNEYISSEDQNPL